MSAGLEAQVPVRDLVGRALAGRTLEPQQWRLLAFYSWETDQEQVAPEKELATRLEEPAARTPASLPEVRERMALKSLGLRSDLGPAPASVVDAGRRLVEPVLQDPAKVSLHADS